ncbi:MAG: hypothetical protein QME51_01870 [Planctomycetota bacterium]|nr:hypothetical protein [Planctomycetota bacterium]MDI6787099.1 hypothetical protein [Planctomycetota bacterium]
MTKVTKGTELWVTTPNRVGIVAGITHAVSATKTNIIAMTGWGQGDKGSFKMLTSNNKKASDAIKKLGYEVTQKNVVLVEVLNKPSALYPLAQKVANSHININYCYGTGLGTKAMLVFSTDNDTKTMQVIRK